MHVNVSGAGEIVFSNYMLLCNVYLKREQKRPPLLSRGRSFWLKCQRSQVRLSALPDFLNSSESVPGSIQHPVDKRGTI
jgi:hypothetical protein